MAGRAAFLTSLRFVKELGLIAYTELLCALRSVAASQTSADAFTYVCNICAQRLPSSKSGQLISSNDQNMAKTSHP